MSNYEIFVSKIIPGYIRLTKFQKRHFESSPLGQEFKEWVENAAEQYDNLIKSSWGLLSLFVGKTNEMQEFQDALEIKKNEFLARLNENSNYKNIVVNITSNILLEYIPDFYLLGNKAKKTIAKQPEFQQITTKFARLQQELTGLGFNLTHKSEQLKKQVLLDEIASTKETIKSMYDAYYNGHENLKSKIKKAKFYEKIKLHEFIKDTLNETSNKLKEVNQDGLAEILYQYMSMCEYSHLNLDDFYHTQARILSKKLAHNPQKINAYFENYTDMLVKHIIQQLQFVNSKLYAASNQKEKSIIENSLAYMYCKKQAANLNEFLVKLADAHAFIQATGYSTQNESSFLAILDVYNYNRHYQEIANIKTVLQSLYEPFKPIIDEYRHIALYEKNEFKKIIRMVIPLLIPTLFVVLTALMIAPFAIPDLALLLVSINAIILGLFCTAKYISYKDSIFKALRNYYYGGAYNIPEFQINERMINAFGSEENAQRIREIYIELISKLDLMEIRDNRLQKAGLLSAKEIQSKKENLDMRHQLCLEWYDIHSNTSLGISDLPAIVGSRLNLIIKKEHSDLINSPKLNEELAELVNLLAENIKQEILNFEPPTSYESNSNLNIKRFTIFNHQGTFFAPQKVFKQHQRIEMMDRLAMELSNVGMV